MKKVIIIGAGFGGLSAAKKLAGSDFQLTIIDKTNHIIPHINKLKIVKCLD